MSRNPFRKARDDDEVISPSNESAAAGLFDFKSPIQEGEADHARPQPHAHSCIAQPKAKSTKKKKVVIKTPPRSPEEPTRRLSLGRPPSPIPQQYVEPVDHSAETQDAGDLILDEALANARRNSGSNIYSPSHTPSDIQAPFNPFARTLATSESKYGVQGQPEQEETDTRTKPAFDIDTFKNILLNGAAPPVAVRRNVADSEPANASPPAAIDTSPFDAAPSYTSSTSDFEGRFPALDTGLPQRGLDGEVAAYNITTAQSPFGSRTLSNDYSSPVQIPHDRLNPRSPSGDAGRSDTVSPKAIAPPPPPPATRRQAQHSSSSNRQRSSSVMSKSSIQSDSSSIAQQSNEANSKAPPPPPSRRAGTSRPTTSEGPLASPTVEKHSMIPPPAPAPRRAPSKAVRSEKRLSALQPLSEASSSNAPPRPPPRRAVESARSSVDGSLSVRRSSQDSRSVSSDLEAPNETNLLSDLAALQKEVDDLVAKAAAG